MSLVVERFLDFSPPSLLPYTHALVAPEGTYGGVRDVFREMVSQSLLQSQCFSFQDVQV